MLKKSFWVLIVFTLVSCLPVPWTKVDYKSPTTRQYNLQDQPDIDGEHGYLWMKNALIILFMRAHDETLYAGSSPYHFLRYFRQLQGATPHQYLTQIRLQYAEKYLRQTALSLESIAQNIGFSDGPHLSRSFRKQKGVSPRQYRRHLK